MTVNFLKRRTHKEQIELKRLEKLGLPHRWNLFDDNVLIMADFGLDDIKRARVEKFRKKDQRILLFGNLARGRRMEWESPWGLGFPGWH